MILDDLRTRFIYTADATDHWTVLRAPSGPLKGDCDDFALTVLWITAGQSWWRILWLVLTVQACMWYTRTPRGRGHMMLWMRGHGWIDNIYPDWGVRRHPRIVPYVFPLFVMALIIKGRGE